jgi:hypothetical protein
MKLRNREPSKEMVLSELEKMPIVAVACKKARLNRATLYRWCAESKSFSKQVKDAIAKGVSLINDLAESKLINGIEDGEFNNIKYWLNNRHPDYSFRYKTKAVDLITSEEIEESEK